MPFVKLSFRVRPLLCAVFVASCSWAGSVFDMPGLQDRFMAIKQELMNAVQARNASAMEDACRAGRALLPEDPVFAYNLACALAMQGRREAGWVHELGDGQPAMRVGAGGLDRDEVAEEPQRLALSVTQEIRPGHTHSLTRVGSPVLARPSDR